MLGVAYVTIGQVLLHSKGEQGTTEIQLMKPASKKGKNDTPTGQYLSISLEKLPFTTKDLSSVTDLTEDSVDEKSLLKNEKRE